ncbi:MAG: bacterial Ig-like domain-containing protein, partial [Christensenellales bacterium]
LAERTTVYIGAENTPDPEAVCVYGVTASGNVPLTKDVDYEIDLGGLDFEKTGTYTITYTYKEDTNIQATLTVEVAVPKYWFSAVVENGGGKIYYNSVEQPNGYGAELEANSSVTLNAVASEGYEFIGWYTATDVPALISENAEYTFVTGDSDQYVTARFAAKILYLWSDSANAGFNDSQKSATVTIGDTVLPNPEAVLIYGGTVEGDVFLTKDVDYTINLGGLDFAQAGVYTITYTYTNNTSLSTSLTVTVVAVEEPVTINLTYDGTADPVKYNGGRAAYVFKTSILNNGEACDIEDLGLSYEWRDHTTKAVVAAARDDTWDSTSAHYPSPAVPGTYDFVVYCEVEGVKTDLLTVTRTIIENQFTVVSDISTLSEYTCYTFIAKVGNDYYAMSNPFNGNTEREAIKVTPDENGVISLGSNYEYVFRPYDSGKTSGDLTCYGCRTGWGLNRTGNLILWGEGGGIEYSASTNADYTLTISINADGTVTVHAPFCGGTLRLVYDETTGKYLFTAKKANDDTRTSYSVYLYGEYTEPVAETKEAYEFYGKLSKEYDGKAVSFNIDKDVNICTENGESASAALKNGTGRFVWTDSNGNVLFIGTPDENGDVAGPSAIGSYRLVFQTMQKGENGMEWAEKAVLHYFEITDPNEVN